MKTPEQPVFSYQVGGTLGAKDLSYVEREADLELYEGLKKGDFCYVLNSRQTGKSSLALRVREKLKNENFRCVFIDLTKFGKDYDNLEDWCRAIFSELVKAFEIDIDRKGWWDQRAEQSATFRLDEFFDDILLQRVSEPIVIFIDEIDTVLSLNFAVDDFFNWIRSCYNKRAEKTNYQRLHFCLLGVASPYDLIRNKNRTPFNIGKPIKLTGFQFNEAKFLVMGLENKVSNPLKVLEEILSWTGGQPFLTQKLCQIVATTDLRDVSEQEERFWVESLVKEKIINNWESQDHPQHLRTIRDRLEKNKSEERNLLKLYQLILQNRKYETDQNNTRNEIKLELSGLVVKENNSLKVYNPIYERVFNQTWIQARLETLKPYEGQYSAWEKSEGDDSLLLAGQDLEEALSWQKKQHFISSAERQFIQKSLDKKYRAKYDQNWQVFSNKMEICLKDFGNDLPNMIDAVTLWAWTGADLFLLDHVCGLLIRFKDDILKRDKNREIKFIVENLLRKHLIEKREDRELNEYLDNLKTQLLKGSDEDIKSRLQEYQYILEAETLTPPKNISPEDTKKQYLELLRAVVVINQEGNLKVANKLYRSIFSLEWVKKELKNADQSQQSTEPYKIFVLCLFITGLIVAVIWSVYMLKTQPSEKTIGDKLNDYALIQKAIEQGKNNLVVPNGIDEICKVSANSSDFRTAQYKLSEWLKDRYWSQKVNDYLRKKQSTVACPAAPKNLKN